MFMAEIGSGVKWELFNPHRVAARPLPVQPPCEAPGHAAAGGGAEDGHAGSVMSSCST